MIQRRYILGLFLLFALIGGVVPSSTLSSDGTPTVTTTADGVRIAWTLPAGAVQQPGAPLTLSGYTVTAAPGRVRLPVSATLLAVPPTATVDVQVEQMQERVEPLLAVLEAAPVPAGVTRDAAGALIGGAFVPTAVTDATIPPLVQVEEAGVVRGVRLVRVLLHPLRPDGDQLRVAAAGRVHVRFHNDSAAATTSLQAAAAGDPILQAVQQMVANPAQVVVDVSQPAPGVTATASTQTVAAIDVDTTGITAVTHAALNAAGFPVSAVDPANLHLTRNGAPVAMEWVGDGDDTFEAGERFLFYADPRFSRWQTDDTYLLAAENSAGPRIGTAASPTGGLSSGDVQVTQLFEQNHIYTPDCICGKALPVGRDGDRWTWDDLRRPGGPSESYALELPTVDATQSAELTLWFIGFTSVSANPDHQVDVSLNNTDLGSVTWDGKSAITETLTIPAGVLQTSNSLTLTVPERPSVAIDGIWLDAVALTYARGSANTGNAVQLSGEATPHAYTVHLANTSGARVYDVTTPQTPVKLSGLTIGSQTVVWGDRSSGAHGYAVANQAGVQDPVDVRLLQPLNTANVAGADYLVIAPQAFAPALAPLLDLRRSQGLSVAVEHVEAIYDVYNGGRLNPEAIHDFLTEAYNTWSPRPTYVLLVGDGSIDPKQYRADSHATYVPPYLFNVDPWIGEVPADNRYVTVDGSDLLPDMLLGRLPVNSVAETETVVAKLVGYETTVAYGGWNGALTFVADDTDLAGNFALHSDRLINNYVQAPRTAHSVYYDGVNVDATTAAIQQRWQQGNGLMVYNGHSSIHQWAAERLFHIDDVDALQNSSRLPVVLQMTCFTGSFHLPGLDAMDEALLRHPGGGAVAVWGATGLGVSTGHELMAAGFMESVLVNGTPEIGTAVLAGKVKLLAEKPVHQDLVDTFALFGDPATRFLVDVTTDSRVFLPFVQR